MSFSARIVLGKYLKGDGTRAVYLRSIIDRQAADVPLGFYLRDGDFDKRKQHMNPRHPNAKDYDVEFMNAIAKANTVASKFRQNGLLLNPEAFKKHYTDPTESMDLIKFMVRHLELKRPSIKTNTHKQHTTVINKLKQFRKVILFNHIDRDFIQKFRNKLITDGNGSATIEKVVKILKQYLLEARKSGISVKEIEIKIKAFKSTRNALTEDEVLRLDQYYNSAECPRNFKRLLQYFLFSCYTGLRISDIKVTTWKNIDGNILTYIPVKTDGNPEPVMVPLLDIDKKYLPEYTSDRERIFKTYSDQINNRYLKKIAATVGIKKKVTYHTSRHTCASLLAESGDAIAVQMLLGHSDIRTSMGYVHTNIKQLIAVRTERFSKIK